MFTRITALCVVVAAVFVLPVLAGGQTTRPSSVGQDVSETGPDASGAPKTEPKRGSSVADGAAFFDPATIARVEAIGEQMRHDFARDLVIETYAGIPDSLQGQFRQLGKDRFYLKWSYDRARSLGLKGVYILITREPKHIQVIVGSVTQQKYFPTASRDKLAQRLITEFKHQNYDGGIVQAAEFIRTTMMTNAQKQATSAPAQE